MFTIKLVHRLKPYSHLKKCSCLIPNTEFKVEVAPTLLKFTNLWLQKSFEIKLGIFGPVTKFTVQQEIEKGKVVVFMHTAKGYVRYCIFRDKSEVVLRVEKAPRAGLHIDFNKVDQSYKTKSELVVANIKSTISTQKSAHLFLGCTKAQDVENIKKRGDLKEILPFLFAVCQKIPHFEWDDPIPKEGMYELLKQLKKEGDESSWLNLFNASFESIFSPRVQDTDYQGLVKSESDVTIIPLLYELKLLILNMFIKGDQNSIEFFPNIPKDFVSGKLKGIELPFGIIDLEWTKGQIRRISIQATCNETLTLKFPKKLKVFRLSVKGERETRDVSTSSSLRVMKKGKYYLDNFAK
ncbi:MAG: hypothetical protein P0S95_03945 [Rhabdochlamydiaceae bacterium]|nr:hypothetical protein [Candidatus Amphrikana amoebophyrae]